ncbi:hypothetical protein MKW94_012783 [Papaver nudicaule]|uniref:FACT complex subunit n=1 Tax=Papaver nudicaule TaxID=74823 RepID=A0AA41RZH8_PAPNU|nr:hypothetical protein [Papaver nudicaule]
MFINARKFRLLRTILVCRVPGQCLHLLYNGFRGINLSGWPEVYKEEQRKHDQANYARRFEVQHKQIFGGFNRVVETGFRSRKGKLFRSARLQQQMEERKRSRIIRLSDVTILPKVGGQAGKTIVGTLKVCGNEFVYITTGIHVHLNFDNIKYSFVRLGDERIPPLLCFHLRDPISVGTGMTRDIQFHLVHCPTGRKRFVQDSDKAEQEKKEIRVGEHNIGLNNFVDEVRQQLTLQLKPPCRFEEIDKDYEFYGVLPSKTSVRFTLTYFSLVVFEETHFFVVPLRDIEVVNLALLRPGEFDMTVMCQNFQVDSVLEINSIPLKSLAAIKCRLNDGFVKYYVNNEKPDWKSIVKDIAYFPAKFMENGGWDHFELEDSHTFVYYKETDIDPMLVTLEG